MRMIAVGAALGLALVWASQARAGNPTNVHQLANVGNGFSSAISSLFPFSQPTTTTKPQPIARPQQIAPRNTGLSSFLPKIQLPSAKPIIGQSFYPTESQMPGAAYLKAFGARIAPRVPLN